MAGPGWDDRVIPDPSRRVEDGRDREASPEVGRARMRLVGRPSSPSARGAATHREGARGQSLVEFALIVTPLFLLLLAVVQFGFIFNAYVTLTNAAREAARTGTIVVYDRNLSKAANDLVRHEAVRDTLVGSMNLLGTSSPQLVNGSTWTQSGSTYTNGDIVISYELPGGMLESDPRTGQRLTVRATYHLDLIVPLISNLLPKDLGGRLALPAEVTMVIN